LPAICREPAARPVHAGCQAESSRLVLLPLRGRSRDKPRSYRDRVDLMFCFWSGADARRIFDSSINRLDSKLHCRSALARDLPGTGSKTGACRVSGRIESPGFATAARQIAGKVERHPGRSYRDSVNLTLIVPTLRVVTQRLTLRVNVDAERPGRHSNAERGNDRPISPALRYLWETSEVTRGWAALRANAVGQVHRR